MYAGKIQNQFFFKKNDFPGVKMAGQVSFRNGPAGVIGAKQADILVSR